MSPESKVVSKETAERLKAAGFQQETERYWRSPLPHLGWPEWTLGEDYGHGSNSFAAPDASELIAALRAKCDEIAIGWNDSLCFWRIQMGANGSGSFLRECGDNVSNPDIDSLVEALAHAWLTYGKVV